MDTAVSSHQTFHCHLILTSSDLTVLNILFNILHLMIEKETLVFWLWTSQSLKLVLNFDLFCPKLNLSAVRSNSHSSVLGTQKHSYEYLECLSITVHSLCYIEEGDINKIGMPLIS